MLLMNLAVGGSGFGDSAQMKNVHWNLMARLATVVFVALGTLSPSGAMAQGGRVLAPGVLTVIQPKPEEQEMASGPLPLVEVPVEAEGIEYTPNFEAKTATVFERSKGVILRRPIWNLEFAFKPLRMIEVDVPQPSGKMSRKLVWYMVYRVKNNGGHFQVKEDRVLVNGKIEHTVYTKEVVNEIQEKRADGSTKPATIRFFPHFVLESTEFKKQYLDLIIPSAMEAIKKREFPRTKVDLHDTVSISEMEIPLSDANNDRSVWGVVTWTDVDPRIDYFSVFVQGLTNAYRFEDTADAYKKAKTPGAGRKFAAKTLQLNFWRPGDTVAENDEEIRYGCRLEQEPAEQAKILAQYGLKEPLDYLWIYR